jgi:hypothetical protein
MSTSFGPNFLGLNYSGGQRGYWEETVFISDRLTNLLLLESSPVRLAVYHETLECVWVAHIVRTFLLRLFGQVSETITVQTCL